MAAVLRLAPVGDRGASLYNSYHLLSQLAGLYDQAGEGDQGEHARAFWDELSQGVVSDLGDLVGAWEAVSKEVQAGKAGAAEDERLGRAVTRTCARVDRIIRLVNVWTPMLKQAQILCLVERRWQSVLERVLARLDAAAAPHAARLKEAQRRSLDRASRLTGRIEVYRRERLALTPAHAGGDA